MAFWSDSLSGSLPFGPILYPTRSGDRPEGGSASIRIYYQFADRLPERQLLLEESRCDSPLGSCLATPPDALSSL